MKSYNTTSSKWEEYTEPTDPGEQIFTHVGKRFSLLWQGGKLVAVDDSKLTATQKTKLTEKALELGVL